MGRYVNRCLPWNVRVSPAVTMTSGSRTCSGSSWWTRIYAPKRSVQGEVGASSWRGSSASALVPREVSLVGPSFHTIFNVWSR